MPQEIVFRHQTRGPKRPQIVFFGNGLERKSNQPDWNTLVQMITADHCTELTEEQKKNIPFPLLYVLLSTSVPTSSSLSREDLVQEEHRLAAALHILKDESNPFLDRLPFLEADHIFTTNYSYCMEKAFYLGKDFSKASIRSAYRFNLNPNQKNGKQSREVRYRLHSGYYAQNAGGSKVGLWHVHGERSVPQSVVLGHDRYGRLLSRMESICSGQVYGGDETQPVSRNFTSWPELFLYGDVYIIGFGFWECELDLWWLLGRKQRERYADGKVFFYDKDHDMDVRKKLLSAHGVNMCSTGDYGEDEFDRFYLNALDDIRYRIRKRREEKGR